MKNYATNLNFHCYEIEFKMDIMPGKHNAFKSHKNYKNLEMTFILSSQPWLAIRYTTEALLRNSEFCRYHTAHDYYCLMTNLTSVSANSLTMLHLTDTTITKKSFASPPVA
jgi:hypothetical protein